MHKPPLPLTALHIQLRTGVRAKGAPVCILELILVTRKAEDLDT